MHQSPAEYPAVEVALNRPPDATTWKAKVQWLTTAVGAVPYNSAVERFRGGTMKMAQDLEVNQ